jgi:cephalosporin hydroxylase
MGKKNLLIDLMESHTGKYSDKWSSYLGIYWDLFEPILEKELDLLEIGVQNGGSLEVWGKLLPKARNLFGFDIHPKCLDLKFTDPRIKVFVEDASQSKAGEIVREKSSNLGVVIDDGSHVSRDVIRSFLIFFPQLTPGGFYVIEDLHASYWLNWQGGLSNPESSMQFLKLLADVVNFDHWGIKANRTDLFELIPATNGLLEESALSEIESVSFLDSVCIIRKRNSNNVGLGPRVGSGSEALVFDLVLGQAGDRNVVPDQSNNSLAVVQDLSPISSQIYKSQNQDLQAQNQDLQAQNQDLQAQNQHLQAQNQHLQAQNQHLQDSIWAIQTTLSWRITKPLRDIRVRWPRGNRQQL